MKNFLNLKGVKVLTRSQKSFINGATACQDAGCHHVKYGFDVFAYWGCECMGPQNQ